MASGEMSPAEFTAFRGAPSVTRKAEFEAERAELTKLLQETTDDGVCELIRSDIAHAERILQLIRQVIPD